MSTPRVYIRILQLMDKSKFAVSTYNRIADKYTQRYFNDLTDAPCIDKFLALLPKGAKVLDIGCGPGTFTKYLVEKGFDAEGIDLSSEMLRIAKEKVPKAKFTLMDMRELAYSNEDFDGLLAAYSLIHIPSEEIPATLKGFYRILKSGGVLLIIAPKGEPDKIVDEPLKEGEKIFINFFTKNRLTKFFTDAGFKVEYQEETAMKDPNSLSDRVIYIIAKRGISYDDPVSE